jgi:PleD family two-component response regulator
MERAKDSKRAVIIAMDDLFFASKIRASAEAAGIATQLAKDRANIIKAAREVGPALIIIDLHARKFDPLALGYELKHDESLRDIKLVGFFSHVQADLHQEAQRAGFDYVLTRSAFTKRVAEILQAYS